MKQFLTGNALVADHSGQRTTIYYAPLPEHQTFDDCMRPDFWMHNVHKITGGGDTPNFNAAVGHKIEIWKADTSSGRMYRIVGIGKGFIKLMEIERSEGPSVPEMKPNSALKARWNPGKKGHEVVRVEGENQVTVLSPAFQTKAEAVEWINKFADEMAA